MTYKDIEQMVFNLVGFAFEGDITYIDYDGVFVEYDGKNASIGANAKPAFARGCFLLAKELRRGNKKFTIKQKAHFDMCGAMIDMSRNGVMTVAAVKQYINYMAALGMNMVMLYTEDTYEMKEYPYFGYLRGRYTEEELREIDDYAYSLGIEVIPCIQTLGHLEQYLQWEEAHDIMDTKNVLLVGEPKTYAFIEAAIGTMRKCFRSNRIHVGMDEAFGVGLGKYLDRNGYQNRFEILNTHLKKVLEICEKYDFSPMMWSDMYFRLASKTHEYYDLDTVVPQEIINDIPDVGLVLWCYRPYTKEVYESLLQKHIDMHKEVIFAGEIRTWRGFVPEGRVSIKATNAALSACIKKNVKSVFCTMWGNDGCETNYFLVLPYLAMYAEYCYLGEACTEADYISTGEFLFGVPVDFMLSMSKLHGEEGRGYAKSLFYGDVFYHLPNLIDDFEAYKKDVENAYALSKEMLEKNDDKADLYKYFNLLSSILLLRTELRMNLRDSYLKKDRNYLAYVARELLPSLCALHEAFLEVHKEQWLLAYKPFGLEVIIARQGGTVKRIQYAAEYIEKYLDGTVDTIPMLDEKPLPDTRTGLYKDAISTTVLI